MGLAELFVQKKQAKQQSRFRTAFAAYSDAYKALALEQEIDHDELEVILGSAGKTESDLLNDVKIRREWLSYYSRLLANRQAAEDKARAERDVAAARAKLQEAIDRLQPSVDAAHDRLNDANLRHNCTMGADAWLCEHVQDAELLEREVVLNGRLREINAELRPLLDDRSHKASSLLNAEMHLQQLTGRAPDAWPSLGMFNTNFWRNQEIKPVQERVDDLKNQIQQLDRAIQPRQAEQQRLQAEMAEIHAEKLKP